jgi:hypothetical protein
MPCTARAATSIACVVEMPQELRDQEARLREQAAKNA